MRHKFYTRLNVVTGESELLPFGSVDGYRFDVSMPEDGYDDEMALLIVNRWNYISSLQSRIAHVYYVPTVEGAR